MNTKQVIEKFLNENDEVILNCNIIDISPQGLFKLFPVPIIIKSKTVESLTKYSFDEPKNDKPCYHLCDDGILFYNIEGVVEKGTYSAKTLQNMFINYANITIIGMIKKGDMHANLIMPGQNVRK